MITVSIDVIFYCIVTAFGCPFSLSCYITKDYSIRVKRAIE